MNQFCCHSVLVLVVLAKSSNVLAERILNAAAAVCSITGSFNIRPEYEADFESALNQYKGV
jgi:hypothetical protein